MAIFSGNSRALAAAIILSLNRLFAVQLAFAADGRCGHRRASASPRRPPEFGAIVGALTADAALAAVVAATAATAATATEATATTKLLLVSFVPRVEFSWRRCCVTFIIWPVGVVTSVSCLECRWHSRGCSWSCCNCVVPAGTSKATRGN